MFRRHFRILCEAAPTGALYEARLYRGGFRDFLRLRREGWTVRIVRA